jgi:hypothetical protein
MDGFMSPEAAHLSFNVKFPCSDSKLGSETTVMNWIVSRPMDNVITPCNWKHCSYSRIKTYTHLCLSSG